jgi:Zn-dependent protease/CBS domain-containing protein
MLGDSSPVKLEKKMEASVKLGRIWGIPIGLHTSWFIIFALITWSLATGYFPTEYPQLSQATHWLLGVLTSGLFFGSVLAHELGHSYLALRYGIPVKSITLFIFGGVAQIGAEPRSPKQEFWIAVAGPIVSLSLALIFGALFLLDRGIALLAAPSLYLMRINGLLALFNLIPGFPLDGGRVLRAIAWKLSGNFQKATRIASFSGQAVAFGFIGLGLFTLLSDNFFNGLWLVFIGWFLQNAAASVLSQVNLEQSLQGVKVAQVMSEECPKVSSGTPLDALVEEQILRTGQRCFYVADDGDLEGLLTLQDISQVPRQSWSLTTVGQAMVPIKRLVWVEPNMELIKALQSMDQARVAQVPVLDQGKLVGVLTREQIIQTLRARAELGV